MHHLSLPRSFAAPSPSPCPPCRASPTARPWRPPPQTLPTGADSSSSSDQCPTLRTRTRILPPPPSASSPCASTTAAPPPTAPVRAGRRRGPARLTGPPHTTTSRRGRGSGRGLGTNSRGGSRKKKAEFGSKKN